MRLFQRIYPRMTEGKRFYYDRGYYFDLGTNETNIPLNLQGRFRVPATNPEYKGKSMSVKGILLAVFAK